MDNALLAVHRVRTSGDPKFEGLMRIYTEALPESERKSVSLLRAMMERDEYFFVVVTRGDVVVGFAITICFAASEACLLEYMAIDKSQRGLGVGQFLFQKVVELDEVAGRFLLAEVESDKGAVLESSDKTRRKVFYRRLGCREIEGLGYVMPPVSSSTPPAMDMLVYKRELPETIEKREVRAWLECSYVEIYGMAADDSRIDAMLEGLPDRLKLI